MKSVVLAVFAGVWMTAVCWAADDSGKAADGAAVGASTGVLASAGLDAATSTPGQPDSPNRVVIKRAIVGAVTGAAAAEMSGKSEASVQVSEDDSQKAKKARGEEAKKRDEKAESSGEGFRPPGWDRGKKTGWGDSDVPPGLADKDMPRGLAKGRGGRGRGRV